MRKYTEMLLLVLLVACQSTPKLEEDPRYAKLATVVDKHEFSETERKQAQANSPGNSRVGIGFGLGVGSGGSFGGMMLGMGSNHDTNENQPQVAKGAIRYTVQTQGSEERTEVISYSKYQVGDCVKVLTGHPSEYPRFFELKPGERCN